MSQVTVFTGPERRRRWSEEERRRIVLAAFSPGAVVTQVARQFDVSTALIYPPGHYAKTDELVALASVASQYGGIYATHMRSEGHAEMDAINEAIRIGRDAHLPVEIFHMKVSGKTRWGSMPNVVAKIEAARESGVDVAADMYPYLAGATALASCLPPWVADGGTPKLLERLRDPGVRQKIKTEMAADHPSWENLYFDSGGAPGVMISGVVNPELKKYDGKTIAEMAASERKDALDALFGPFFSRLMLRRLPYEKDYVERLAETVLHGIAAQPSACPPQKAETPMSLSSAGSTL